MNPALSLFHDIVRSRHSVRGFLPSTIPRRELNEILEDAQHAPSNCNTQPWNVHVVSGAKLAELSETLLEAMRAQRYTLDFSFDKGAYPSPYEERANEQGRAYYRALGVAREDTLTRAQIVERNVRFFDAPHAAFLFMPSVGDNVRIASDVGMYAQTFLLALTARGYAGVPQAALSYFADTVRRFLAVPEEMKLLFGISFGTADPSHAAFDYREGRASLKETVMWHA